MKKRKFNWLRLTVFFVIIGIIISLSVVGGIFIPQSAVLGIEFSGGTQVRLEVTNNDTNRTLDLPSVSEVILRRVDSLGVSSPAVEVESGATNQSGIINVTLGGYQSADSQTLSDLLESGGGITFTDTRGAVLLNSNDLTATPATLTLDNAGQNAIGISFVDQTKFATVTRNLAAEANTGRNFLTAFLDLDGLLGDVRNDIGAFLNLNAAQTAALTDARIRQSIVAFCSQTGLGGIAFVPTACRGHFISSARVAQEITGNAVLSGNFSRNEAQSIVNLINSGTIDYDVNIIEQSTVTPTFGTNAFSQILIAALIALSLVAIFLILYYGIFGILAFLSMVLFVVSSLFIFNQFGGEYAPDTVAALIIGIGISSDSAIVTLERLKREFQKKKVLGPAYLSGSIKSLPAILDSNITTFITAFMLFWFGTRSIRGFSVMLINSILWTLVISVFLNRVAGYFLVKAKVFPTRPYWYGIRYREVLLTVKDPSRIAIPFHILFLRKIRKIGNKDEEGGTALGHVVYQDSPWKRRIKSSSWYRNFNILDSSRYFIVLSLVIVIIGIVMFSTIGPITGLDFSGGTRFDIFVTGPRTSIDLNGVQAVFQQYTSSTADITFTFQGGVQHLILRTTAADTLVVSQIQLALQNLNYSVSFASISGAVALSLINNALIAVGAAMGVVFIYCFFRFSWTYSLAAILTILHDVLILIAIATILRIELRVNAIAAILATIGYSINDTIVTFSRIREEMNSFPATYIHSKKDLRGIASLGIKQTIKRSILTTMTTVAATVSLLILGPEATYNFSALMLIGLVFGTYSSIFIASRLWIFFHAFKMKQLKKKLANSFTEFYGPDEQLVVGINV